MTQHGVIVVGGGISGLTAAWRLRGDDVLVLEAADIVGGRLKTETRTPYWLNLGAHVLMAGGPMATLAAEAGVPLVEPTGDFLAVAMKGRVVRAGSPSGMFLKLPLSLAGRASLAATGARLMSGRLRGAAALEALSFAEFLGPMHPDVTALMRVVANRLTGELDDISALVGVNGFQHLWLGSRLNIAGGSAALPAALARPLGDRVVLSARVTAVRQTVDTVTVEYVRHGVTHVASARKAIVAVPAPLVSGIVADLPPALVRALASMRYTPFVVAGIFTDEAQAMPWDDIYAMAAPESSFCMFFNPANAVRTGDRKPGGSLVVYSVAARAAQIIDRSDADITALYLNDLTSIFPQARGIVREVVVQRWRQGTATGYPGRAANVEVLAKGFGRIAFAGDYMMPIDGVDASESGAAAAALAGDDA